MCVQAADRVCMCVCMWGRRFKNLRTDREDHFSLHVDRVFFFAFRCVATDGRSLAFLMFSKCSAFLPFSSSGCTQGKVFHPGRKKKEP